jgi:hypothetical protein
MGCDLEGHIPRAVLPLNKQPKVGSSITVVVTKDFD